MSRLRIRMELNRGGVGVPLHKLARVVDEAEKFFRMLGEDVHIDQRSGVWLGGNFDNKSLNFTAEYVGPVEPSQIRDFHAAFDGVTLLRRATITQFARIADAIEEDELIGFGLYQNDDETEPSEWRSLSRRDALRITDEIRLLLDSVGEGAVESRLPAALDPGAAATLFKDRREHGGLADRVARLENEVNSHSEAIQDLRGTTTNTEQNLQKLLLTVDAFCDRATRQMEKLPAASPQEPRPFRWRIPATIAALCVLGVLALFRWTSEPTASNGGVQASDPVPRGASNRETPQLAPQPAAAVEHARAFPDRPPMAPTPSSAVRLDLKAHEPTWVAVYIDDKLSFAQILEADQAKSVESTGKIRMRLGNAGGVEITANGKPVGSVGRKGQVRMIEFTADGFHIIPLDSLSKNKPGA